MRFRGPVEATAVVLGAMLLACVFTYPYIVNFNDAGRLDTNDGRWSIWVVSWVAHALTTDPAQLFRANIFYPHQNALAFSEGNIVEGVIGAPVWAADQEPVHDAQLRLPVRVRAVVRRDLLPDSPSHRRSPRRDRRGHPVRVLPVRLRAAGAHPAADDRLPAVGDAGVAPVHGAHDDRARDRARAGAEPDRDWRARITASSPAAWSRSRASGSRSRDSAGRIRSTGALVARRGGGVHRHDPALLPALPADAGRDRVRAVVERPVLRQPRRVAGLIGVGAPLVGAVSLSSPSEVLFPGILAIVLGVWGARSFCAVDGSATASAFEARIPRDVAWFYIGLAVFTFWLTLGPEGRPLHARSTTPCRCSRSCERPRAPASS